MARPILIINGTNFTEYVAAMAPSKEDLDADGAGRDVQTGEMHRKKIADKLTWEVAMLRLPESVMAQLHSALNHEFYNATTLIPGTGAQTQKRYYTSSIPYGAQRYDRYQDKTFYDGVQFKMVEK